MPATSLKVGLVKSEPADHTEKVPEFTSPDKDPQSSTSLPQKRRRAQSDSDDGSDAGLGPRKRQPIRKTIKRVVDEDDGSMSDHPPTTADSPIDVPMESPNLVGQNGHSRLKRKARVVDDDEYDDFKPDPPSPQSATNSPPRTVQPPRTNGKLSIKSKGKASKANTKKLSPLPPVRDLGANTPELPPQFAEPKVEATDDAMEVDSQKLDEVSTAESAQRQKKRRLPPIKKKQLPPDAATTPSSKPPPPSQRILPPEPSFLAHSSLPKKPAANGTGDFDLRNPDIYANLFKTVGDTKKPSDLSKGSMSRKEKEEARRKELDEMRDAARAKRSTATPNPFDLQSQGKKIARFEERMQHKKLLASPHILAAGFAAIRTPPP